MRRRGRVLGGVRPTSADHRATTFELFFDLVYVFAATQVTPPGSRWVVPLGSRPAGPWTDVDTGPIGWRNQIDTIA